MRYFWLVIVLVSINFLPQAVEPHSVWASCGQNDFACESSLSGRMWESFKSENFNCANLKDADFEALGHSFAERMMGEQHEQMDRWMEQMMGEDAERQMNIAMGKRISGCDPNASYPGGGGGLSMMNWGFGGMGSMMGGYGGWGLFGTVTTILVWLVLLLGVIALARYITSSSDKHCCKGGKEEKK